MHGGRQRRQPESMQIAQTIEVVAALDGDERERERCRDDKWCSCQACGSKTPCQHEQEELRQGREEVAAVKARLGGHHAEEHDRRDGPGGEHDRDGQSRPCDRDEPCDGEPREDDQSCGPAGCQRVQALECDGTARGGARRRRLPDVIPRPQHSKRVEVGARDQCAGEEGRAQLAEARAPRRAHGKSGQQGERSVERSDRVHVYEEPRGGARRAPGTGLAPFGGTEPEPGRPEDAQEEERVHPCERRELDRERRQCEQERQQQGRPFVEQASRDRGRKWEREQKEEEGWSPEADEPSRPCKRCVLHQELRRRTPAVDEDVPDDSRHRVARVREHHRLVVMERLPPDSRSCHCDRRARRRRDCGDAACARLLEHPSRHRQPYAETGAGSLVVLRCEGATTTSRWSGASRPWGQSPGGTVPRARSVRTRSPRQAPSRRRRGVPRSTGTTCP